MYFLEAFFLIGAAILGHETGHFIAARLVGIPVRRFSIGYGPRVWCFTRNYTEYRLSLIPIGGYVLPAVESEEDFFGFPVLQRIILAAGGPIASFILPVICFGLFNTIIGGLSVANIIEKPWLQMTDCLIKMVKTLPVIFSHHEQLSGIVGMVAQGGHYIGNAFINCLPFLALISLNLGLLNLLPIPALDGGKILLYLLEKIHPRLLRLHLPLAVAGWLFMIGLMVYVTINDISKYFFKV